MTFSQKASLIATNRKFTALFKVGISLSILSLFLFILSYSTPYWIKHNSRYTSYKMKNMGLWEVCFRNFRHPKQTITKVYDGCHWVFSQYFNDLLDYLERDFVIATQVLLTFSLLLSCVSQLFMIPVVLVLLDREMEAFTMLLISGAMFLSTIFNLIGLCVYSHHGLTRDWLLNAQWWLFSWSFYVAWLCFFTQLVAFLLLLQETLTLRSNLKKESQERINFGMSKTDSIRAHDSNRFITPAYSSSTRGSIVRGTASQKVAKQKMYGIPYL